MAMDVKKRIDELEAKAYFDWGLNNDDSDELDELIRIISNLEEGGN